MTSKHDDELLLLLFLFLLFLLLFRLPPPPTRFVKGLSLLHRDFWQHMLSANRAHEGYTHAIPPANTTFKVIKRIPLDGMKVQTTCTYTVRVYVAPWVTCTYTVRVCATLSLSLSLPLHFPPLLLSSSSSSFSSSFEITAQQTTRTSGCRFVCWLDRQTDRQKDKNVFYDHFPVGLW